MADRHRLLHEPHKEAAGIGIGAHRADGRSEVRGRAAHANDEHEIGFRSGEYFGRKKSLAPAARMARRTALALCEPRLSMMTMSPGWSVGTRTFSM